MHQALIVAGARMALPVQGDPDAAAGNWALAVFEVATGKRATAAAGRIVRAGDVLHIEFERRDWERLNEFATPWDGDQPASAPHAQEIAAREARALVVEDERVCREMVTTFLLGLGLVVRPAPNAERAALLLESESFDLAVLDVVLPGMNGLELCESIRARTDERQRLPVLILTGDSSEETARRAAAAGADDFITKPVPVLEFRARVLALLRRGRGSMP